MDPSLPNAQSLPSGTNIQRFPDAPILLKEGGTLTRSQVDHIEALLRETSSLRAQNSRFHFQLTAKQSVIDDVLQTLHKCMKEETELKVQNEILQSKFQNATIETEKLRKTSNWYRSELQVRTVQWQASQDECQALRAERDRLRVQLRKTLSECEILGEKFELERKRNQVKMDRSMRQEFKDSGIFSESALSSHSSDDTGSELDVSYLTSSLSAHERTIEELRHQLELQIEFCSRCTADKSKEAAEREMCEKQLLMKENLLQVQRKALERLQEEVNRSNKVAQSKARQVDQLTKENNEVHRESMEMILKFEKVSSIILEYRREIHEKDKEILVLRQPRTVKQDQSTQTNNNRASLLDKGVQVARNLNSAEGNHYRNLLKVMEREFKQKMHQRDVNMRTLLRQVREHMQRSKKAALRHQEVENKVQEILLKVIPPSETDKLNNNGLVAALEQLDGALQFTKVIPQTSSPSGTQEDCKLCDSLKLTLCGTVDQLKESHRKREEELLGRLAALEEERKVHLQHRSDEKILLERQGAEGKALKLRVLEMEERLIEQAKYKDTAENERQQRHQLMVLLIQIKNERDDLLCQTDGLNKVLREMWNVPPPSETIAKKALAMLQKSAKFKADFDYSPLGDGINGLKQEVASLNGVIRRNRGEMSLLEELQAFDNFL